MNFLSFTKAAGAVVLGMIFAFNANATPILLSDGAPQTVDSQNFNFSFSGLDSNVGGGLFTLTARGDYSTDGVGPDEEIAWSLDGIVTGVADVFPLSPEVTILNTFNLDEIEFVAVYNILAGDLTSMLADGILNISLDLGNGVDIFSQSAYVDVMFEYESAAANVPAPTSIAIFGLGLLVLSAFLRLPNRKTLRV